MLSMRRMGLWAGGMITALVVACSAKTDHPPPAEVGSGASSSGGSTDAGPLVEGGVGEGGGLEGGVVPPLAAMDPKGMFLLGTLQEGLAGREVLASLADANVFSAGFDSVGPSYGFIHPTDGFVYIDDNKTARKFVADPNPKLNVSGTSRYWVDYPKDPEANDPTLPMLPCTNDVQKVFYAPDTGKYFHTCTTSANDLRDDTGAVVATCLSAGFLAVGYNKTVLCREVVYDSTGASHPLDPSIPTGVAYRGKADGTFHLVSSTSSTGGSGAGATYALWNVVPATGAGTKVYDYAKLAGFSAINADARGWITIDGDARLYRWGSSTTTPIRSDVIARFDDKGGELVYNETGVHVKMHGSNMITGF